jgi:hypothetical protein
VALIKQSIQAVSQYWLLSGTLACYFLPSTALSSESVLRVRFTILSAELLQDIFLRCLERTVLDLSFPCPSVCGGSYDVSQFHNVNASHCPRVIT